ADLGTMEFGQAARSAAAAGGDPVLFAGFALIIVGIGFKLALFPFHTWTPDVYEGAPAPVSAFVATVSKGAVFALLVRYFGEGGGQTGRPLFATFWALAVASMFAGNLLALFQENVKRMLAYSSIAHVGYLLVAFLSAGRMMVPAVSYYLAAYFATMLGAFGVVTITSGRGRDADLLEDYRGLAGERPWLAGVFTVMLLSLAGIPLTAGFIGKFYVVAAGVDSALWVPVLALAMNSAIGLFYYLRVVTVMFAPAAEGRALPRLSLAGGAVVVCLTGVVLCLGVFPSFLVDLIRVMTSR
ncbi:MAG: NADH-quinone oxidoreductase subunit N, partial [Nitrospiraceae bacterium]|nr:NADH-quinone oxidoreductase subunit N [Nitrospiraceae bacterium]